MEGKNIKHSKPSGFDNKSSIFNKWQKSLRILLAGLVLNSGFVMANPNSQDQHNYYGSNGHSYSYTDKEGNLVETVERNPEMKISKEEKEIISNAIDKIINNESFTEEEKAKLRENRNTLLFLTTVGEIHFLFVNDIYTWGIYGDNFIENSFNLLSSIYTEDQLEYFVSRENEFILKGINSPVDKVMKAYKGFYKKLPSNIIICDSIKKQYEENIIRRWVKKMYKNEDNHSLIYLWKYRDDLPADIRVFIDDREWEIIDDIFENPDFVSGSGIDKRRNNNEGLFF